MVKKIALLFPGQGSQSIDMGRSYADRSAGARNLLAQADRVLGFELSKIMFEGPEEKLRETAVTQPALFVASAMALELLAEREIRPTWAAGHSLGEYSALYAAGALSFENALKLVQARGRAMQEAAVSNPGSMAAIIGLPEPRVTELCAQASSGGEVVAAANFNSESQIVISGHAGAVARAMEIMKEAGAAKVVQLNVSGAFHSPLMSAAAQKMRSVIDATPFSSTKVPVITNVDARPTTDEGEFRRKLVEQIDHPVRWHDTLARLNADGAEIFIETGSGKVLGTMAKKFDRSKTVCFTDEFDGIENLRSVHAS